MKGSMFDFGIVFQYHRTSFAMFGIMKTAVSVLFLANCR